MARETEKVVSFTELSLNAFCPNKNNASQSWPTVQLAVPLCACTGLLVQHYSNCECTGLLVQHYSNCACTGLLVQYSLTVITINNNLTQCTVGADQMLTNVYTIS